MKNSVGRMIQNGARRFGLLDRWTVAAVTVSFFIALAVILLSSQFSGLSFRVRPSDWEAGKVAEKDFVVERDFPFVDEKATQIKREAREKIVPPVFMLNEEITTDALKRFDAFGDTIVRLVEADSSVERILLRLQVDFPGLLSATEVRALLGFPDVTRVIDDTRLLLSEILSTGVVVLSSHREEIMNSDGIELWKTRDGRVQAEEITLDRLNTLENLSRQLQGRVNQAVHSDAERRIVPALLRAFAVENAFYDAENTAVYRTRLGSEVEPVTVKLVRGQVLIRKGDIVSDDVAAKVRALGAYSMTVNINGVIGSALFLILVFAVSLFLLMPRSSGWAPLRRNQVNLVLAAGLTYLLIAALTVRFFPLHDWVPASVMFPTGAVSILISILISSPTGASFSLVSSLAVMLLTGMNVNTFLFALFSGLAGAAVVMNAERRIDLIRAGLILALLDSVFLAVVGILSNFDPDRFLVVCGWGIANGFLCGVLSLGFLPIFEHLLNSPTRFRLMELSNLNSPIFKRMLSLAPGTYTHSISVANLAETACEAIGANALLARVSAYYHDIGKIDQADYFIENQKTFNKHDEMKASLSVAVIKSHLRIGIEKAKELALPQEIIDIIAQHHGRGLITYFYHRAMSEEKNSRVSRDDYSYPGARPKSKEAAVLLLADTVDAASRTLKKPTRDRLERFVWDIIMGKFHSGELGDSNLSLRDLETIRKSFVRILEGYFHTRIEYPKLKEVKAPPEGQSEQAKESLP
jgi:hypothetical protein